MPIDLINIPRAITGIAEWLFMVLIITTNVKRIAYWKVILLVVIALPIQIFYMTLTGNIPVQFWILAMIGAVFLIFIVIYITCDMDIISATYHTAKAFVLAEFAASFEWQIYYFIVNVADIANSHLFEYIFSSIIFILIFVVAFLIEFRYTRREFTLKVSRKDMISIVSIVSIVFAISNVSFLGVSTPISGQNPEEIFYIRTLVDLCGIILIYMHREHHFALHTKNELFTLKQAFQSHYNHYQSSRDNLDLINQRFHDLKHQISLIRAESDSQKQAQYLEDIEKSINDYGIITDTGYHVLDTIITTKRMVCMDADINFTYVIDGSLLKFMNTVDISSLFGNALDNAIDSVKSIEDKEKRIIKVAVYHQKALIMIKFENYYEHDLVYDHGHLVSTKDINELHGYGIKSINNIAKKYHGNATITTKNQWFELSILLPIDV
ncbi:MAG: ATP-binding protein [Acholeplasmataceae bacterium]|jgi:hypothetical protein|nr:ATP-binding protein [Acholeplasmataceae bacterium]